MAGYGRTPAISSRRRVTATPSISSRSSGASTSFTTTSTPPRSCRRARTCPTGLRRKTEKSWAASHSVMERRRARRTRGSRCSRSPRPHRVHRPFGVRHREPVALLVLHQRERLPTTRSSPVLRVSRRSESHCQPGIRAETSNVVSRGSSRTPAAATAHGWWPTERTTAPDRRCRRSIRPGSPWIQQ